MARKDTIYYTHPSFLASIEREKLSVEGLHTMPMFWRAFCEAAGKVKWSQDGSANNYTPFPPLRPVPPQSAPPRLGSRSSFPDFGRPFAALAANCPTSGNIVFRNQVKMSERLDLRIPSNPSAAANLLPLPHDAYALYVIVQSVDTPRQGSLARRCRSIVELTLLRSLCYIEQHLVLVVPYPNEGPSRGPSVIDTSRFVFHQKYFRRFESRRMPWAFLNAHKYLCNEVKEF